MAKNLDSNPLERHIEKIVLGVCALALVVVVAHWVVSSPQTVEVIDRNQINGTTTVPPHKADEEILAAAHTVRDRNQRAVPQPLGGLHWESQFAEVAGKPFPPIALVDDGSPSFPIRQPKPLDPNALPSLAELTAMVQPPGKPFGWRGLEVRQPALEEAVFHGVSIYPWGDLKKRWEEKLSRLPNANIVVLRVEAQVQTRFPDGQYQGEEGIPAHLAALPPVDSQGQPLPMPVIPDYDGNNATAVRIAVAEIASPRWQAYILTPPYYKIASRGGWVSWRLHLMDNPVSRLELAPIVAPPAGVGPGPVGPATIGPSSFGPGSFGPGSFGPGPRGPGPMGPGPVGPGPSTPSPTVGPSTVGPEPPEEPVTVGAKNIPDLAKQQEAGTVLLVIHDNTLKIGIPCRYRIRVVFVNPLLTQDAVQNKAKDSFRKEIVSPWSEWSDDVLVPNPTRFFLTRKPTAGNSLQVTVFTQKMGQMVKKTFDIEPGMAIGGPAQVPVAMAANAPTNVDFSTGCVAVAFDMERKFTRRSAGGGTLDMTTASMVYLDEKGQLRTRVLAEDENSQDYADLRREAGGSP